MCAVLPYCSHGLGAGRLPLHRLAHRGGGAATGALQELPSAPCTLALCTQACIPFPRPTPALPPPHLNPHPTGRDFLLRLPHNKAAFATLAGRGPHPAYARLAERLPMGALGGSVGRALAQRLEATLSQLAYWCPVFGERLP